jgi:GcrA cell cycle regulator
LRECRWPIGHPGEAGFRFCGAKTQVGSVYCDQHAEIAFTKPSGRTVIGRSTKRR